MSEFSRYSPPESRKPAPLTSENRFERVEQDKSPEVKKDTKYEPGLADQNPLVSAADDQKPLETPNEVDSQRIQTTLGKTGISSMQGDAPADDPTLPVAPPSDTVQGTS